MQNIFGKYFTVNAELLKPIGKFYLPLPLLTKEGDFPTHLICMVRLTGFEPVAPGSGGQCSIH